MNDCGTSLSDIATLALAVVAVLTLIANFVLVDQLEDAALSRPR